MRIRRRDVLVGGAAVGIAACQHCPVEYEEPVEGTEMRTGGDYTIERLEDTRPLALHAEVNLASNQESAPNSIALVNPHPEPWEVHEIKFSVRPRNATQQASGGLLSCGLSLGPEPITDSPVPVWNFGPSYEPDLESVQAFNWGRPAAASFFFPAWDRRVESYYRWKLDWPLFILPGQAIIPHFRHTGLADVPITAGITVSGRRLLHSPSPRRVKVPFVSVWQSNFYSAVGAAAEEFSPESTLRNQFNKPLTVERFIGRICQRIQSAESFFGPTERFSVVTEAFDGPWAQTLFKVRQNDSMGNVIIRDKTGYRSAYGYRTRAWHCQHVLPPGQYHKVRLNKELPAGLTLSDSPPATIVDMQAAAQLSMVGWREVSL